jgi:hypothetical protein
MNLILIPLLKREFPVVTARCWQLPSALLPKGVTFLKQYQLISRCNGYVVTGVERLNYFDGFSTSKR